MTNLGKLSLIVVFSSLVACTSSTTPAGTATSKDSTNPKKDDAKKDPKKEDAKPTDAKKSSTESSATCGFEKDAEIEVTKITGSSKNDPSCPSMTPEELNAGTEESEDSCKPTVDEKACKMTLDCTTPDSHMHGELVAKDGKLEGDITITAISDGTTALECTYTMTFAAK